MARHAAPPRQYASRTLGPRLVSGFTVATQTVVAVSQVVETNLAQAITWAPKRRIVGQVIEINLAQAVSKSKVRAVTQVVEIDLAQAISKQKIRAVAMVVEVDLPQAITRGSLFVAVGQVTEINLAQVIGARKIRSLTQVTETDLVQAISTIKQQAVGQVIEIDLAQAVGKSKSLLLGQTTEIDLAQAIGVISSSAVQAFVLRAAPEKPRAEPQKRSVMLFGLVPTAATTQYVAVAQVVEVDLAQAVAWAPKARLTAQVTEIDLAQAITLQGAPAVAAFVLHTKAAQPPLLRIPKTTSRLTGVLNLSTVVAVGQVVETDLSQPVAWAPKARLVNLATETDLAQAFTVIKSGGGHIVAVDLATETDLAQPIGKVKTKAIGQATETSLAQPLTHAKLKALGQVVETDLARLISWAPQARLVNQANEFDQAFGITVVGSAAPASSKYIPTWRPRRR